MTFSDSKQLRQLQRLDKIDRQTRTLEMFIAGTALMPAAQRVERESFNRFLATGMASEKAEELAHEQARASDSRGFDKDLRRLEELTARRRRVFDKLAKLSRAGSLPEVVKYEPHRSTA